MKRIILIVDDIKMNREVLMKILQEDYEFIQATNGQEALEILNINYKKISAVLLDIIMPVMDGFSVLEYMRHSKELMYIPVIITTAQIGAVSEVKALKLGANDYIAKPYNTIIIRQRIQNAIYLHETAITVNELSLDELTGLFNREVFFKKAEALISEQESGTFVMSCFNIDNFKIVNDQYGIEKGDQILKYIADCLKEFADQTGAICCRVMADNFAMIIKSNKLYEKDLYKKHRQIMSPPCINRSISIRIGRYLINDLSLSVNAMYDRASLAEISIKGRYDKYIAVYDESMRQRLIDNQEIVNDMDVALKEHQFEVWFQPQYDHSHGTLIGAEALVRWRHPKKGLISPGKFIPVFEQNGFIYELDKYVWEESCRYLRKWIDEGKHPVPVSVNISRYDIFIPDVFIIISGLIAKYDIPVDLLRLEITESAFAESTQQIVKIVKQLIQYGFTIEIDDFGSGYSSLNTLKNVPAQVIKLDMRFLENDNDSQRGGNILESIVRMTKWLGMTVIAEGVEKKEQADFLKSIGCSYIQGYFYARPMPANEYEKLCKNYKKETELVCLQTIENLNNNTFWDPKSIETLIFNSYIGGACIFEYYHGKIEFLRVNDKYIQVLGSNIMTINDVLKLNWCEHLDEKNKKKFATALLKSLQTFEEVTSEFLFIKIPGCEDEIYLRSSMRVIATSGDHYLVYCTNENITAQRKAEHMEKMAAKQLQVVIENMNCGITAVTYTNNRYVCIFANNQYYSLFGYTKDLYEKEIGTNVFSCIHPDDTESVTRKVRKSFADKESINIEYRAFRRNGSIIWIRNSIIMTTFDGIDGPVQLSTFTDITDEKLNIQKLLDNLPSATILCEYDGKNLVPVHINKQYWKIIGCKPINKFDSMFMRNVHPEDIDNITKEIDCAIKENRNAVSDVRILLRKKEYRTFHITAKIVSESPGKYSLYALFESKPNSKENTQMPC